MVELIVGAIVGAFASAVIAPMAGKKHVEKKKECPFSSVPYLLTYVNDDVGVFCCPACSHSATNNKYFPICEDLCYPQAHFHFVCNACKFRVIMRTKNDSQEELG